MKFSIRDLLLVTVIAALALGWWVDRRRLASQLNSNAWRISGLKQDAIFRYDEIVKLKQELKAALARVPNSSAPTPNPPKK